MKKRIDCFLLLLITLTGHAQNDLAKQEAEFRNLIKNTNYGKNEAAGKYYEVRGMKMYCEIYGAGEPLLLIHGNGLNISSFAKQIPYFAKKYKVIVADSRSQGKSVDKNDSLSYEMMTDDYAGLLTAIGIDSANVIGWSDGGINGLLLAIRHPKKVKKLIVTGANLQPDTSAVDADMLEMVTKTYHTVKQKENKSETDTNTLKLYRLMIEQPNIPVSELHKIRIPVLVIGGDHDIINVTHTMDIFRNIPRSYLWILPNSGHSTPIMYADDFNKQSDSFLKGSYRTIKGRAKEF